MATKPHIDALDRKILKMLMQNARIPFLEVGRACKVSGAAIHQRVQKLEEMGVIEGSCFLVDPKTAGYKTRAFLGVFLEKAHLYKEVVKELEKIPEIVECNFTTGTYSIFLKIYARDNEHLKEILNDKIQSIPGVSTTETFISLEEAFHRQVPLGD